MLKCVFNDELVKKMQGQCWWKRVLRRLQLTLVLINLFKKLRKSFFFFFSTNSPFPTAGNVTVVIWHYHKYLAAFSPSQ